MNDLKLELQRAVRQESIDLIGFADKSRFEALPPEKNPFTIFPEGKTVILIGKRICRGSLRGVEEGTNFGDYGLFGLNWLEDEFLSIACYGLVNILEDNGWEAVPLFPNPDDMAPSGVSVDGVRPAPNVYPDFEYAAVACGLCEISYSCLPMSTKFGTRQRFHMVITDAEIEPTPLMEKAVCLGCKKCAEICPLGAISMTETEERIICGKKMTVAKVDYDKCRKCQNGAVVNRLNRDSKPDRVAALCNRTCMGCLEAAGVLENKFENVFRKREAWRLDAAGNVVEENMDAVSVQGGSFGGTRK